MARDIQQTATNPDELSAHDSPDPLTGHSQEAGVWGLPSDEGAAGQAPPIVPNQVDYSGGMFVGAGFDADAQPALADRLIPARVDTPRAFELPHEATHRRYEPPRVVAISQTAAGYSLILPGLGLHYVKLIAMMLTLDAAGTIQFVQGPGTGTGEAGMTGTMALGGASAPGFVLPPAELENPWLFTTPDLAFGLITATGKAAGWAVVAYSPYDQ